VKAAIEKAVEANGPVLIDFVIEREENVSPMVPAGAAINEILDLEDIQ
jgi:acetolactate synthase I/II/III large subunit